MLKIQNLVLENNIIAAPLAGFTDVAWRILARNFGAGLLFSEMLSVGSVVHNNRRWKKHIANDDRARPYAIQLFGSEPKWFEKTIKYLLLLGDELRSDSFFDLIDINMGCPVKKVVGSGAGSALMKDEDKIEKIISACRKSFQGPLTVKIRSGWSLDSINAVEVARIAQEEGADAITVHPRTRSQGFSGKADWRIIAEVKNAVKIPVIGNGDVIDKWSAYKMFDETGCDGIMVGRASVGNPWIFRTIKTGWEPNINERFNIFWQHHDLLKEFNDNVYVHNTIKKVVPKYFKGIKGVKELSRQVNGAVNLEAALESFKFFENLHDKRD